MKALKLALWVATLGLIALCYWPGLHGGFVFDDAVNILFNDALRIEHGTWGEFWAAATSGHAGPLGRPIALVSFALNYYAAGSLNAFDFKLTNLAIHLANTFLVGLLTFRLQSEFAKDQSNAVARQPFWTGLIVAAIWGLHPLNLTAVLYAVQRMTSLSTLFGLLALNAFVYLRVQTAESSVQPGLRNSIPAFFAVVTLLSLLTLSILSKESGILFIPLILWTEICIFRFQYFGVQSTIFGLSIKSIVLGGVAFSGLIACLTTLPGLIGGDAYANREFTLTQRLLSETRALAFYLRMFVAPQNSLLALYHDDFEVSTSLISPISTLWSSALLLAISIAAWAARTRFPALTFAWGWFLISHSLESTVIPLELIYEHRNYLAIAGLLIGVASTISTSVVARYRLALVVAVVSYTASLAFITYDRALQWSNTVDWAALEAEHRPKSMRANYELARNYMQLRANSGDDRFGELAQAALVKAEQADPASLVPQIGQAQLAYMRRREPDAALLARIQRTAATERYRNVDTSVLSSLVQCQIQKQCSMPHENALGILSAALDNPRTPPSEQGELLKLMAQYKINLLEDLVGGTELIARAIRTQDRAETRIMYAQALAMGGKFDEALLELKHAEALDRRHAQALKIERERKSIAEAASQ